jgi:hypothetical protein
MIKQRLVQAVVFLVFVFIALYLIKTGGERGLLSVMSILSGGLTVAWIIFSGNRWWILMPVSVAFGGTFLYEYKFYVHEITLSICLVTLLPVIALRRKDIPERTPLPGSFYALLGLFVFNWVASCYALEVQNAASFGSITRTYLHGFWGVLFAVLFYKYGLLKPRVLLGLIYAAYLARAFLGGLAFLMEDFLEIPKVGFALTSATAGVYDFRVTGIQLVLLGFVFAKLAKSFSWRIINLGVMFLGVILVGLGGGRVAVGMICCVPLIWGVIQKKMGMLVLISVFGLSMLFVINQYPYLLYELPTTVQRALSVLVAESSTKGVDWQSWNQASDYWHRYLRELGWAQWTQSPLTILFGNRVEAFSEAYNAYSVTLEIKAEIAAKLGVFESGLWTVLGLMGASGFVLYASTFVFLLKTPFLKLKKEGISGPAQALGFIAVIQLSLWVIYSWTAGSFPSYELMMAVFANVACIDEASAKASLISKK